MKWDWSNANWKDEAAKGVECNNKKTGLTARSKAIVKVWPILSKKTQHLGQLDLLPHLWKASSCQSHGTVKRVVRNKRRSGQARQDRKDRLKQISCQNEPLGANSGFHNVNMNGDTSKPTMGMCAIGASWNKQSWVGQQQQQQRGEMGDKGGSWVGVASFGQQ